MGAVMEKLFVPVGQQIIDLPADLHCQNSTYPMYFVPENPYGVWQLIFLGGVYAYILFNASNLISDGELTACSTTRSERCLHCAARPRPPASLKLGLEIHRAHRIDAVSGRVSAAPERSQTASLLSQGANC